MKAQYRLDYLSALKEIIDSAGADVENEIITADDGERDTQTQAKEIVDHLLDTIQYELREFRKDVVERSYPDFCKIHGVGSY